MSQNVHWIIQHISDTMQFYNSPILRHMLKESEEERARREEAETKATVIGVQANTFRNHVFTTGLTRGSVGGLLLTSMGALLTEFLFTKVFAMPSRGIGLKSFLVAAPTAVAVGGTVGAIIASRSGVAQVGHRVMTEKIFLSYLPDTPNSQPSIESRY